MEALLKANKEAIVLGLGDATGEITPRRDIDWMIVNQPDTFNLFALAFEAIQNAPKEDLMGFFQIAGEVASSVSYKSYHNLPRLLY